jgi:hypothetical protein
VGRAYRALRRENFKRSRAAGKPAAETDPPRKLSRKAAKTAARKAAGCFDDSGLATKMTRLPGSGFSNLRK